MIFDSDAMGKGAEQAGDFVRHAEKPEIRVDVVTGLLHERAAAVDFPSAAIGAAVVVALIPPELAGQVGGVDAAKGFVGEQALQRQVVRIGPALIGHGQRYPRFFASLDHAVHGRKMNVERFFGENVLAELGRFDGRLMMQSVGCRDDDRIVRHGEFRQTGRAMKLRGGRWAAT